MMTGLSGSARKDLSVIHLLPHHNKMTASDFNHNCTHCSLGFQAMLPGALNKPGRNLSRLLGSRGFSQYVIRFPNTSKECSNGGAEKEYKGS